MNRSGLVAYLVFGFVINYLLISLISMAYALLIHYKGHIIFTAFFGIHFYAWIPNLFGKCVIALGVFVGGWRDVYPKQIIGLQVMVNFFFAILAFSLKSVDFYILCTLFFAPMLVFTLWYRKQKLREDSE